MTRTRAVRLAAACLALVCFAGPAATQAPPAPPRPAGPASVTPRPAAAPAGPLRAGGTIQDIKVEGNARIETGTVRSYMLVQPGDPFDADRLDRSLKTPSLRL